MPQFIDLNHSLSDTLEQAQVLRDRLVGFEKQTYAKDLDALITDITEQKFAIGVVGQTKRGKSTLINVFLGRADDAVAPIDDFPATHVISMFCHAPTEEAQVIYQDGRSPENIPFSAIRQFACEAGNPNNTKGVKSVVVAGPFPGLEPNVVLLDTPGAHNVLADSHHEVLLAILPRLDAVVFMVSADSPMAQDEIDLLKRIRGQQMKKILFAVNKEDLCTPKELEEGNSQNKRLLASLGYGDAPMFSLSAKKQLDGQSDPGTQKLIAGIRHMISQDRLVLMAQRAKDRLELIRCQMSADLTRMIEDAHRSDADIAAEKRQIHNTRRRLESGRTSIEAQFHAAWGAALGEYERHLPALRRQISDDYTALIAQTGNLKIADLGKMLHTDVVLRVQEMVQPHSRKMEDSLNRALALLETESLRILVTGDVVSSPIVTNSDGVKNTLSIGLATVPALAVAAGAVALPGTLASIALAAAPTVVTATLTSPSTWLPALGSFLGGGAATVTGSTLAAIATPIAILVGPLALAYAGYRAYSAWESLAEKSRNTLQTQAGKIITECIEQLQSNAGLLRSREAEILGNYFSAIEKKLSDLETRLDGLMVKKVSPEELAAWQNLLRNMAQASRPTLSTTPSMAAHVLGKLHA